MADPTQAERTTGYIKGGISPLGQKKRLPTFLDSSAKELAQIYVSGGKRGLTVQVAPEPMLSLVRGEFAHIAAD